MLYGTNLDKIWDLSVSSVCVPLGGNLITLEGDFFYPFYPSFGSLLLQLLPFSSSVLVDLFKSIKCVAKDAAGIKHQCCQKINNESNLSQTLRSNGSVIQICCIDVILG